MKTNQIFSLIFFCLFFISHFSFADSSPELLRPSTRPELDSCASVALSFFEAVKKFDPNMARGHFVTETGVLSDIKLVLMAQSYIPEMNADIRDRYFPLLKTASEVKFLRTEMLEEIPISQEYVSILRLYEKDLYSFSLSYTPHEDVDFRIISKGEKGTIVNAQRRLSMNAFEYIKDDLSNGLSKDQISLNLLTKVYNASSEKKAYDFMNVLYQSLENFERTFLENPEGRVVSEEDFEISFKFKEFLSQGREGEFLEAFESPSILSSILGEDLTNEIRSLKLERLSSLKVNYLGKDLALDEVYSEWKRISTLDNERNLKLASMALSMLAVSSLNDTQILALNSPDEFARILFSTGKGLVAKMDAKKSEKKLEEIFYLAIKKQVLNKDDPKVLGLGRNLFENLVRQIPDLYLGAKSSDYSVASSKKVLILKEVPWWVAYLSSLLSGDYESQRNASFVLAPTNRTIFIYAEDGIETLGVIHMSIGMFRNAPTLYVRSISGEKITYEDTLVILTGLSNNLDKFGVKHFAITTQIHREDKGVHLYSNDVLEAFSDFSKYNNARYVTFLYQDTAARDFLEEKHKEKYALEYEKEKKEERHAFEVATRDPYNSHALVLLGKASRLADLPFDVITRKLPAPQLIEEQYQDETRNILTAFLKLHFSVTVENHAELYKEVMELEGISNLGKDLSSEMNFLLDANLDYLFMPREGNPLWTHLTYKGLFEFLEKSKLYSDAIKDKIKASFISNADSFFNNPYYPMAATFLKDVLDGSFLNAFQKRALVNNLLDSKSFTKDNLESSVIAVVLIKNILFKNDVEEFDRTFKDKIVKKIASQKIIPVLNSSSFDESIKDDMSLELSEDFSVGQDLIYEVMFDLGHGFFVRNYACFYEVHRDIFSLELQGQVIKDINTFLSSMPLNTLEYEKFLKLGRKEESVRLGDRESSVLTQH